MENIFLTRQPIHNHLFDVIGYQILYAPVHPPPDLHGEQAAFLPTSDLVTRVAGSRTAFLSINSGMLFDRDLAALPLDRTVLQLPPELEPDPCLEERLGHIETMGARFALDRYSPRDRRSRLLNRACYLKVDFSDRSVTSVGELFRAGPGPDRVVACRVDSYEQFEDYRQQGVRHFQGVFFRRPRWNGGRRLPASSLAVMQLLARLQDPSLELTDIEAIVERDVSLSYRLLRYLNSVHFSLRSPIESIGHALSYLGVEHLRVWLSVLLLARLEHKPVELMKTALTRARMCQGLIEANGGSNAAAFLLGLFSALDALLDQSLEEAVRPLPVSDRLKCALIDRSGEEGGVLEAVLAWEDGNWERVGHLNILPDRLLAAYLDAVTWADGTAEMVLAK